jgi:hypothetical protein
MWLTDFPALYPSYGPGHALGFASSPQPTSYIADASPSVGEVVVIELNDHWQRRLVAVRRLL